MLNESVGAFLSQFDNKDLVFQTPLVFNNQGYAFFPDNYYRLDARYDWSSGKPHILKYKDGERRRVRLYVDALMIRAIRPNITFTELLYNLVFRRQYYYDNSDGVLTNRLVIECTNAIMAMPAEEIETRIRSSKHGIFSTDPIWCMLNNVTRRKHSRTVAKWLDYEKIGEWYDAGISVYENLRYAKQNRIKVCKTTLIRFCKENGIKTNPKNKPIDEWYNKALSVKKNLEWEKRQGIKVSQARLYNFCRQHHINTKGHTGNTEDSIQGEPK